jgi:UDPglucose 6-dehydrogenase
MYRKIIGPGANIARMNFVNAELTKISVNTYVTMKISFANMLGEICDRLEGADVSVVTDAIGRDTRIGQKYLKPAIGYGGPCFPRDTIAFGGVARRLGGKADLALATDAINRRQVPRLTEMIGDLVPAGAVVAVLGLSYKPHTPVIEESQGVMVATALAEIGYEVIVHDPMALAPAQSVLGTTARSLASAREAVSQADVVVIMTPWPDYAGISPEWLTNGRTRFIIDCWRQLDATLFTGHCGIVRLGRQETFPAMAKRVAAE